MWKFGVIDGHSVPTSGAAEAEAEGHVRLASSNVKCETGVGFDFALPKPEA